MTNEELIARLEAWRSVSGPWRFSLGPKSSFLNLKAKSQQQRTKPMDDAIETVAREYCKAAMRQGFHVDEAACEQRLQMALKASGFAVVPVEPSEVMLNVLHDRIRILCDPEEETARILNDKAVYRAMIAAAKGEG